jgi:hypothetical protein
MQSDPQLYKEDKQAQVMGSCEAMDAHLMRVCEVRVMGVSEYIHV